MPETRSLVPDNHLDRIGALVLCGGLGQRMGGVEKALEPWAGQTLVESVIECIRPQVDTLVLSVNRAFDDYRQHASAPFVSDAEEFLGSGPLAGIAAGLEYYRTSNACQPIKWMLVVPCDTPMLPGSLVEQMLSASQPEDEVIIAADDEHEHYAVALLRLQVESRIIEALRQGNRRLRNVYRQCRMRTVHFDDPLCFANINTREELEQLKRHFTSTP